MTPDDKVVPLPTGYSPPPPTPRDVYEQLLLNNQMLSVLNDEITGMSKAIHKLIRILKDNK